MGATCQKCLGKEEEKNFWERDEGDIKDKINNKLDELAHPGETNTEKYMRKAKEFASDAKDKTQEIAGNVKDKVIEGYEYLHDKITS